MNTHYEIDGVVDIEKNTFTAFQTISNIKIPKNAEKIYLVLPPNKFQDRHVEKMLIDEFSYNQKDISNIFIKINKILIDNKEIKKFSNSEIGTKNYNVSFSSKGFTSNSVIRLEYIVFLGGKSIVRDIGVEKNRILLGQFYPYIPPIKKDEWQLNPPHAFMEEFLSFSDYDIKITLPEIFNFVELTGEKNIEQTDIDKKNKTITVIGNIKNAVEFALYATKNKPQYTKKINNISVSLLCDYSCDRKKLFSDLDFVLSFYEKKIGKFPFSSLSIVIGKHGELKGKEYPGMIIVNIDESIMTSVLPTIEMLLFHELAHEYFYAAIHSDQYNEAWIDEGLATYFHRKALQKYVENKNFMIRWFYKLFIFLEKFIVGCDKILHFKIFEKNSIDKSEYKKIAYGNSSQFFENLDTCLGDDMEIFIHNFYQKFQNKQLSSEDIFTFIDERNIKCENLFISKYYWVFLFIKIIILGFFGFFLFWFYKKIKLLIFCIYTRS